jgi:hypothetical protein
VCRHHDTLCCVVAWKTAPPCFLRLSSLLVRPGVDTDIRTKHNNRSKYIGREQLASGMPRMAGHESARARTPEDRIFASTESRLTETQVRKWTTQQTQRRKLASLVSNHSRHAQSVASISVALHVLRYPWSSIRRDFDVHVLRRRGRRYERRRLVRLAGRRFGCG